MSADKNKSDKRKEKTNVELSGLASSAIEDAYQEVIQEEVPRDIAVFYNPEFDLIKEMETKVPDQIEQKDSDQELMKKYEVVLAFNLQPPYKYSQEYFWLEVLAADPKTAIRVASDWLRDSESEFEITSFVRESAPHDYEVRGLHGNQSLRVSWNLPIEDGLPAGTMIRNPITGMRIGFLASEEDEAKILPEEVRENYRLIIRKPAKGADLVILAPIVSRV